MYIVVFAAFAAGTPCVAVDLQERLSVAVEAKFSSSQLTPASLEGVNAPAGCEVYEVRKANQLLAYAVMMEPRSISGPFQALIIIDPQLSVVDVELLNYPHQRGRKVKRRSFLSQYQGKVYGDSIRLDKDIDGVSGATSSASQLTRCVRQALIVAKRLQSAALVQKK